MSNIYEAVKGVISPQEELTCLILSTIAGKPVSFTMELLRELGYDLENGAQVDPLDVMVRLAEMSGQMPEMPEYE